MLIKNVYIQVKQMLIKNVYMQVKQMLIKNVYIQLKQNEDSSSSSEEEMASEDLLSKKLSIQGERYFKAVKGSACIQIYWICNSMQIANYQPMQQIQFLNPAEKRNRSISNEGKLKTIQNIL